MAISLLAAGTQASARPAPGPSKIELESVPAVPAFNRALTGRFVSDLKRSRRKGMRSAVFAKIGDSNIASYYTVYGLGCRKPRYGRHRDLAATVARYRSKVLPAGFPVPAGRPIPDECEPSNSFSRYSTASRSGSFSSLLNSDVSAFAGGTSLWTPDPSCDPGGTVIRCEIKAIRPRYSIVATGTNDWSFKLPTGWPAVERFTDLFKEIRRHGSVPVASTVPPWPKDGTAGETWRYIYELNQAIVVSARLNRVPVMNPWRLLTRPRMISFGMDPVDGLHLETFGGRTEPGALSRSVDFRRKALRYGNNRRNLLLLQTLRTLDRQAHRARGRNQVSDAGVSD